jgi:hypothetical protein
VASWFLNLGTTSVWRVAPAGILALVPLPSSGDRRRRPFLAAVAAGTIGLTVMTAPNDGGSQWGPRYLLPAFVPLAVLAADALEGAVARRREAGLLAAVLVLAGPAWVQRASYKSLRDAKVTYGRVLEFVRTTAPPGSWVVSDRWWLDQIAAAASDERVFLYAANDQAGAGILRHLDEGHVSSVTVIRGREESSNLEPWTRLPCYVEAERREIAVRGLVAIQLRRACT